MDFLAKNYERCRMVANDRRPDAPFSWSGLETGRNEASPGRAPEWARQLPVYVEFVEHLSERLSRYGFLALCLVDLSSVRRIERTYGSQVYDKLMAEMVRVVSEVRKTHLRKDDVVALRERSGEQLLVFLVPRDAQESVLAQELKEIGAHMEELLNRRISKGASLYLKESSRISMGTSLVLRNPFVREERLILRAIEEAHEMSKFNQRRRSIENRRLLQEIILREDVDTVFQPVMDLSTGRAHGFEALSRGPKGSPLEGPGALFEVAVQTDLLFELDHLCRRRAIQASGELDSQFKLFVNTLPFSVYDPGFQGKYLISLFEGTHLAPEQIVLEVTENLAIENYSMFKNAMKYFSNMGFRVAIDDMGSGYSGLEKLVELGPDYVKLDIQMVRDIDTSYVKQQMVAAFRSMTEKTNARIIAEGVETQGELDTVCDLGIDYVQGFYLAKPSRSFQILPDVKFAPVRRSPVRS